MSSPPGLRRVVKGRPGLARVVRALVTRPVTQPVTQPVTRLVTRLVTRRGVGLVCALVSLGACGGGPATGTLEPPRHGPTAMHYRFTLDESLERIRARVCFEGEPPVELSCGVGWGAEYLLSAHRTSASGKTEGQELPHGAHRIELSGVGADGCVEYVVDLQSPADTYGALHAERRGGAIMSNLALWLWRPSAFRAIGRVTARFELPSGMEVSVPWREQDGHYVLDETAFAYLGYAVFGRFQRERFQVPGARVDVAVLEGLPEPLRAGVRPWIEAAARMAAQPAGRFPRDRAQVVVIPSPPRAEPVGFGHATRSGGPSVGIFLPVNSELPRMKANWVAVHELSHFFHPFVQRGDAWLSEGLATYYQEVLRARAGLQPPADAWQRLWEGAQRGRVADRPLARESEDMYFSGNFPMVYWAGAAFALLADVELRKRSDGVRSLDDVMDQLSACCSSTPRAWPARRVLARMDEIVGEPLFERLAARWVSGPRLPELGPLYEELGLSSGPDGVIELRDAPGAALRDGIMRVDRELARDVARLGQL